MPWGWTPTRHECVGTLARERRRVLPRRDRFTSSSGTVRSMRLIGGATSGASITTVAAATALFLVPILVFTALLRKNLLRGITFGAVRK